MASVSESGLRGALRGALSLEMYKRTQGRVLRSMTALGVALMLGWGLWALSAQLLAKKPDWSRQFLFNVRPDLRTELDAQSLPKTLREAFQNKGFTLSPEPEQVHVSVNQPGQKWTVRDDSREAKYVIHLEGDNLQVWTSGLAPQTCNIIAYGLPALLALAGLWGILGLYNWPRFADFLIATEAEMSKVSWSTTSELKRATAVVLLTLFLLSAFLMSVDFVWSWFLEEIGVLRVKEAPEQAVLVNQVLLAALRGSANPAGSTYPPPDAAPTSLNAVT